LTTADTIVAANDRSSAVLSLACGSKPRNALGIAIRIAQVAFFWKIGRVFFSKALVLAFMVGDPVI